LIKRVEEPSPASFTLVGKNVIIKQLVFHARKWVRIQMHDKGLIHVYYGNGKGKTTAALGLAIRAAGCGKQVIIVHFLKSWRCGERESLSQLSNVSLFQSKTPQGKYVSDMNDEEKQQTKISHDENLKKAIDFVKKRQCDVLILDEAIDALNLGVLDADLLHGLIYEKPDFLELIITGHNPDKKLLDYADYVTEMVKHKHPYDDGVDARQGIEY